MKPAFKIGNRVRTSKYDLPFRKGYKPEFTREIFEIVAIAKKNQQLTQSKMSTTRLFEVNFTKKS